MRMRLRAGPFSVSSGGRMGLNIGPLGLYGGGRRRRSTSGSEADGCITFLVWGFILFAVFVVPAALIGHLFNFTPSLGQIFRANPPGWMKAHYPEVVGRFAIVDGAMFVLLIGTPVLVGV